MTTPTHAVVTGGGSGIGLAIAQRLEKLGHRVTIMGRNAERLEAARRAFDDVFAVSCDVGDRASVDQAFANAANRQGTIGILVNCAGVVRTAPFEKSKDDMWNELWQVNVLGAVHTCQAVLPAMKQMASGRIVNIASTASLKGYSYVSAYSATKHALLGLTRSLALECIGTSITVNAVCPGYAETEIIRAAVANIVAKTGRSEAEALRTFTDTNPQGRLIQPEEIAATVGWLVSDAAGSVTGQAIVVAGGEIM